MNIHFEIKFWFGSIAIFIYFFDLDNILSQNYFIVKSGWMLLLIKSDLDSIQILSLITYVLT